jgi:hypothetical protein
VMRRADREQIYLVLREIIKKDHVNREVENAVLDGLEKMSTMRL